MSKTERSLTQNGLGIQKNSCVLRLNSICPYFTMFPIDFPLSILKEASFDDWVLDPFCGRGTTLFAARLRGCHSVGIDSNKVAYAVSRAKLVHTTADDVFRLCKNILKEENMIDIPQGCFWERCYSPNTLSQIVKIRQYLLDRCESDEEIALKALMLGILHGPRNVGLPSYLSNQMPRTYSTKPGYSVKYWGTKGLFPPEIDILDVVQRRASFVFNTLPEPVDGFVVNADSRQSYNIEAAEGFRWVITSPPYLGMVTYKQDQWLRDWFCGGPSEVDYTNSGQMTHISLKDFTNDLARVWKNVADVCSPEARMVIRLGVLPSFKGNAREILETSIEGVSNAEWTITAIESAGMPSKGMRQAEHFGTSIGRANQEIDCYAVMR